MSEKFTVRRRRGEMLSPPPQIHFDQVPELLGQMFDLKQEKIFYMINNICMSKLIKIKSCFRLFFKNFILKWKIYRHHGYKLVVNDCFVRKISGKVYKIIDQRCHKPVVRSPR